MNEIASAPVAAPPQSPVAPPPVVASNPSRFWLKRGLTLVAIAATTTSAAVAGVAVWREWSALQTQLHDVRHTAIVGYAGITPRVSFAKWPENWYHDEGEQTLLWSGWQNGVGHGWFRVRLFEIDNLCPFRWVYAT